MGLHMLRVLTGFKQWQCHTHCTSRGGRRIFPFESKLSSESNFKESATNGSHKFWYLLINSFASNLWNKKLKGELKIAL